MSIQLQLGPLAARPLFYNRVLKALQECPDAVLERISYLTRYLYAQHLKKHHERRNAGLSAYNVPGALTWPTQVAGTTFIGQVKNTVRQAGFFTTGIQEDSLPPPGSNLAPPANTTEYPTQHPLYQFTTLGTQRPSDTTLDEKGYVIYDSEYTYGKGVRISGGTSGSELDIIHTIIRDVLKQIELGDMLGSYFIADTSGSEVQGGVPITAGGEAGQWLDCGEYMSDTLFNPADAQTLEQLPYINFAQVERPYHVFLKHVLDFENRLWPSNVEGLIRYSEDNSLSAGNGLKEFDGDYNTSSVGHTVGVSDTLDNAPALYKDVLLPILFRNYPRYVIGPAVSSVNNKGFIQDFIFLRTLREQILGDPPFDENSGEQAEFGIYTSIAEPRFVDAQGNYLNDRASWTYPNTGGQYYFNTNFNYI